MRVVGRDKLEAFKRKHPQSRGPLDAWLAETSHASWRRWADIKATYPKADWISGNRVVFDIKGNKFRLVVLVYFNMGQVIVERVRTQAEYDKWQLKR